MALLVVDLHVQFRAHPCSLQRASLSFPKPLNWNRRRRTPHTVLSDYPGQEIRDIVIQSGMEAGMQDTFDLLEEVAASLA